MRFSEVLSDNSFRIDSEFFKKEYILKDNKIKSYRFDILKNLSFITDGEHGSPDLDENGKICLSSNNINEFFINENEVKRISLKQFEKNKRVLLEKENILLSIVGTIGKCAIIQESLEAITDRNLATIKPSDINLNKYYLTTFLNSNYGKYQTQRFSTGNVQPLLNLGQVGIIKIPIFSNNFQLQIEDFVKSSYRKLEESKLLYKQAEELLLKELDLLNFKPSKENIAIKSFKESFVTSRRLDSEYYQPKYDEIIEKIKSYKGGFELLQTACNLKDSNHNPKENQFYQYVELSNIGNTGDITGFTYEIGQDLPSRARRKIKENDVIVSSIEGSLEKVALVTKEFDDFLCSTGFYILNSKKINSETLLVLFKNSIFQEILKQNCSGTILTAMNKDEFLNIIIPIIDKTIQIQIEEKIKKSFELKEESKKLLDLAKQAVEIAIEKDENEAVSFINQIK